MNAPFPGSKGFWVYAACCICQSNLTASGFAPFTLPRGSQVLDRCPARFGVLALMFFAGRHALLLGGTIASLP
jgi:hypothetical protein